MADWHWECDPDDLLNGLPSEAVRAVEELGRELAVRDSMIFLDGASFAGMPPGLRIEQRGSLMLTYLTDVRGERIVIIQVTWFD